MRGALERAAFDLTDGRCGALDLPWHQVRFQYVAALRALWRDAGLAPATVNVRLSAVRGVLKSAWQLGLMSAEDYHRAAAVPNVRGARLPAGRAVTPAEMKALFDACARDRTAGGDRDAALLAVLYGGALRRSEASALDLSDWLEDEGRLLVRGKGDRQRSVFLPAPAAVAVSAWIRRRGTHEGPLFHPINKSGRIDRGSSLSGHAMGCRLARRAGQAGVAPCTCHDLRRTHVSDALDNSADITAVSANVGHVSVTTTARYDRRGERAQRKAAQAVHVPYVARVASGSG